MLAMHGPLETTTCLSDPTGGDEFDKAIDLEVTLCVQAIYQPEHIAKSIDILNGCASFGGRRSTSRAGRKSRLVDLPTPFA